MKIELLKHKRTVTHYKNVLLNRFSCKECGEKFFKNCDLLDHKKTHKKPSKSEKSKKKRNKVKDVWISTFFCRHCDYKSHKKYKLTKHEKTHNEKRK